MSNHFKQVLLGGALTFVFKIIGLILAYLVLIIITKKFGSEAFGRYSIVITVAQIIVIIFTFGFPSVLIKLLNDKNHFDEKLKSDFLIKIIRVTFISSLFVSISLYFISDIISINVFNDNLLSQYFKLLSLFIVPLMLHEVLLNYFRGLNDFKKYNIFLFVLPPLFFIIIFYLLNLNQYHEITTIKSYGFGISLVFVIEFILYKQLKFSNLKKCDAKKIFKLSFPMMISGAILFLLNWTDVFMLGAMVTSKEVGIYNLAFKIASVGLLIIIVINVVIGSKISELYNKNDLAALKNTINKSTQLITVLTVPLIFLIIYFSEEILGFFGDDFIEGKITLILLSLGVLINAISGNVDQVLNMTNNQSVMKNITIFTLFVNVILNLILIPIYGMNGAAFASLISNIFLNLVSIYFIKKKLGFYTFI
ncbi:MAG: flippase [Flavobacteriaceae bacterium]|nr:flippase [Flavobacteriaceae bacterium]